MSSCASGDAADIWFQYTAENTGHLAASLCGSGFDTTLAAYTGTCGALTEIACNDDWCRYESRICFPVEAAQPYLIRVAGYGGDVGDYGLHIAETEFCDDTEGEEAYSCAGYCGTAPPAGVCYCDAACFDNDDCCFDVCAACPGLCTAQVQGIIEPVGVVDAGALWRLDDGAWQESGVILGSLRPGWHTVSFSEVPGWIVPESEEVWVDADQTAVVVGLYSMTVGLAVEQYGSAVEPAATAADHLFDAFVLEEGRNGYAAAAAALDAAVEAFVAAGGDYLAFCARSDEIPPGVYTETAVTKRRIETALSKARGKAAGAIMILALPRAVRELATDKSLEYTNMIVFVNGINTDWTGFMKNARALNDLTRPFTARCNLSSYPIWNDTGGFLPDLLLECTAQKLVDIVKEMGLEVTIEHPTTALIQRELEWLVNHEMNVIVVPHSQGNFHVSEAIDNMAMEARAAISVLETGSPASYMPAGLRHHARVDIEGDCVATFSGVVTHSYPYEGDERGWGTWLSELLRDVPVFGDFIDCANRHSFEGAYLKGQARGAIWNKICQYSDCGCEAGATETILLPGSVPLEMICIPAGTFMMGRYPGEVGSYSDEDPQHAVTVPGFWLGKYEVTKAQWTAVMGTTPWSGQSNVLNDPDSPAVYVSWNNAQAFITALNTHTGQAFRLPSEAEWEYACRAGTTTRFYWGDDPSYTVINDYAWWDGNADNVGEDYAHVVGLKLPNGFGLFDMSGNVWEWCEDDWHSNYTGAPVDGSAWVSTPRGSSRVGRGGYWNSYGSDCRSAGRFSNYPSDVSSFVGFRLSRS
ncbi:MAG: Serine/threonine-protein kinase pkn1 [Candidatus Hydrogenedentes bacterium ADurb.Bin101]|nr:MAG: Serine/threonine-protein kinase pkn1 [Candidatus Hydrogenedentes bacterium ADurb.Bin101]